MILKQFNTTTLTMVPKIEQASMVTQFRPIACCNTFYKIISKMLCKRLKGVLPELLGECQGAFISGRSIMQNILLCEAILKQYNCSKKPARCTFKVDLRKAYDFVSWEFIEEMLCLLGFPDKFRKWIMQCISTPTYCLLLNDGLHGFFKRQGH